MDRLARLLRLWFGFSEPVDGRTYFVHGAALMAVKYATDVALVLAVTGRFWSPLAYLNPLMTVRTRVLAGAPGWLLAALLVWTVPFLFIGVNLTMRRAVDAGYSGWLAFWFFVPLANFATMLWLCRQPSRVTPPWREHLVDETVDVRFRAALEALAWSVAVSVPTIALQVLVFRRYSASLFLGVPFSLGVVCAYFYNRRARATLGATLRVAALSVVLVGGALVLLALEGAVCVIMALPVGMAIAMLGAAFGRAVALRGERPMPGVAAAFVLPAALAAGPAAPVPERVVVTAVDVAASPAVVWNHVVTFDSIAAPPRRLFRLGLAYPVHATIDGAGVGAVRRCMFSTGAFVEPVTAWEPARRLAFDITAQPPPMRELSPWASLDAPHLGGYFRAVRGEFRLVARPDGGTRLEGRTWYVLDIHPGAYWAPLTDAIVGRIHQRVLDHIRHAAEAEGAQPGGR